jgi:myosin heavy subunit
MDGVPDNTQLMFLQDPSLLHNIKVRYEKDEIYTLTAYILIAVNPYKRLPLYDDQNIFKYANNSLGRYDPVDYSCDPIIDCHLTCTVSPIERTE